MTISDKFAIKSSVSINGIRLKDKLFNGGILYNINVFLLMIYTLNVAFIPYDNFGLKKFSLMLLLVLNFKCFTHLQGKDEVLTLFFGLIVMMANVIQSTMLCGSFLSNLKIGYTFSILLLYIVIKKNNIDYIKTLQTGIRLLALFIVIMFLLDIAGILSIYANPILMWLYRTENANIGKYPSLLIGVSLFLKASPMLLLGIAESFYKKKIAYAVIFLMALILTGTRANMFAGLFVFVICFVFVNKSPKKRAFVIIAIIVVGSIAAYKLNIAEWINGVLAKKVNSDGIRTGTLDSMFDFWKNNPVKLMTGSGYMSEFYNAGRGTYTRDVELSYWNLLRQVGLIQFCILMFMYLYPIYVLIKKKKNILYVVAYAGYLFVAYTNPFLITSTGLTVVLFMYCIAFQKENDENRILSALRM